MDISKFKDKVGSKKEASMKEGSTSNSSSNSNFTPKDNSGRLFINSYKKKETQPDYKGDVIINEKKYNMSGWKRTSKAGTSYISIALTDPSLDFLSNENSDTVKKEKEDSEPFPF